MKTELMEIIPYLKEIECYTGVKTWPACFLHCAWQQECFLAQCISVSGSYDSFILIMNHSQNLCLVKMAFSIPVFIGLVYSMETSARPMSQSIPSGNSRKRHAIAAIENSPGSRKKPRFQHGREHQRHRKPRRQSKRKCQMALVPDAHSAKGKDKEKCNISSEHSGQRAAFKPEARLPKTPEEASANWKKLLQVWISLHFHEIPVLIFINNSSIQESLYL